MHAYSDRTRASRGTRAGERQLCFILSLAKMSSFLESLFVRCSIGSLAWITIIGDEKVLQIMCISYSRYSLLILEKLPFELEENVGRCYACRYAEDSCCMWLCTCACIELYVRLHNCWFHWVGQWLVGIYCTFPKLSWNLIFHGLSLICQTQRMCVHVWVCSTVSVPVLCICVHYYRRRLAPPPFPPNVRLHIQFDSPLLIRNPSAIGGLGLFRSTVVAILLPIAARLWRRCDNVHVWLIVVDVGHFGLGRVLRLIADDVAVAVRGQLLFQLTNYPGGS